MWGFPIEKRPPRKAASSSLARLAKIVLQPSARLEGRVFARRDLDLLRGAWPDASSSTALPDLKGTEAGQLHLVATLKVVANAAERLVYQRVTCR